MTNRTPWTRYFCGFLAPWLRKRARKPKSPNPLSMEFLEDRTVPTNVPLVGYGEADGYPLQQPGLVTASIDFTPSDPLSLTGNFYESVDAVNSAGMVLSGYQGANLYNTEGPVITVNGGTLNLASGIVYGRASAYTGTITPGNEILVNNNGTLGAFTQDALDNLSVTVESGSQLLLGDPGVDSPLNFFGSSLTIGGNGVGAAGVIQSANGIEIASGIISAKSAVTVGAAAGTTLIINGPVNGLRSANAFAGFSTTGAGKVILDNVLPVATVAPIGPVTTNNPSLVFRVSLSESPQTDLTKNALSVTSGTVVSVTKIDATTFDFAVTATIANGQSGTVSAQLGANTIKDKAYLGNLASNIASVTLDRLAPTGSGTFANIGQSLASATQATINITYSDNGGVGIDAKSIAATNLLVTDNNGGTLAVASNPSFNAATGVATYSLLPGTTWGSYSQNGAVTVTVSLVTDGVRDLVGNGITGGTAGTFIVDTNSPVLTINDGLPIPPVHGNNIVKISSNKPINRFDPVKFTASNGSIVSVIQTDATTLKVTVAADAGTVQQIILLNIGANAITDAFGNPSKPVTPSPAYTFDKIQPTVSVNTPPGTINAGNPTAIVYADFSVFDPSFNNIPGSGVNSSTITLASIKVTDPNGTPIAVTNLVKDTLGGIAQINPDQFPGGSWTNAVQGTYTITIQNIQDNAGNTVAPTAIGTFLIATGKPVPTLGANPSTNIDGVSTVKVDFGTSGNTTVSGLTLSDFSISGSGILGNLIPIGPNQFTVDVTPTSKNASVTLSLPANAVMDNAGNGSTTSNTLNLGFSVSNPIPYFSNASSSPTKNQLIQGVVTFTEAVNLNSGLARLSQSDFNISSGAIDSFSALDSIDGINFPFSLTFTNANQIASFNIKGAIAKEKVGINLPSMASSTTNITLVVSPPTATLASPIAPVNSLVDPQARIAFAVNFTSGLNIGLDYSHAEAALSINKSGTQLSYLVESIDSVNNVVHYLIKPPANGAWTDDTAQGTWSVDVLSGKFSDRAGNPVAPETLGTFEVVTRRPNASLSFPGANAPDYKLVWINASSPNHIVVKVSPTSSNGGILNPAELNTTIVPTATSFLAQGFQVVSVSNAWQDPTTAPYILVTLDPVADAIGDTSSIGPVSLVVKANSILDIHGNGNTQVDPQGPLQNGLGFLSLVGIDRKAPFYSTTGLSLTQINASQTTTPVKLKINYSDATSGVNLDTLDFKNLILTLGTDTTTNVATITGQADPNDNNTFEYTLTPKAGNWVDGTYTLRFTPTIGDMVYDKAFNVLFTPTSANGIAFAVVTNQNQPVSFAVDTQAPTVWTATITPVGPTNSSPLTGNVTFSKPVLGFTPGALGLQGADLQVFQTSDNQHFSFSLQPKSSQESVSFTILDGVGITDTFGNPLVSGVTSNTTLFDARGPQTTLTSTPININLANSTGNTNTFQVTFGDPSGIDPASIKAGNFQITNIGHGLTATISDVTFDAATGIATYTVTSNDPTWLSSKQGLYSITPNDPPTDTLGNKANLPSTSFLVDTVAPEVNSVNFVDPDPTNKLNLPVQVVFSKPVNFSAPGSDFTNLFTVTNGIVSGITQIDPTTFQVNVQPTSAPAGERLVTFQVNANAATDFSGNPSTASGVAQINFDNLGPVLTILPQGLINNTTTSQLVTVNVTVSPASTYNFADQPQAGIVLTNATYVGGSFAPISGSNSQYSFQIMVTNPSQVSVGMGADTFDDGLGNGNLQTTTSFQYRGPLIPSLTSPEVIEGGSTVLTSLGFSALFNGPIESFNPNDFFNLTNAVITNFVQDPTGKSLFTFTVNPIVAGAVSVQVKAGAATDDLGQTNQASVPFTFTFGIIPPLTATLVTSITSVTALKSIPVTVAFNEPVTGLDASNFVGKFAVSGATLNPDYFQANPGGTAYQVLLIPDSVSGSLAPVAVTLQFKANQVTPSNEASIPITFTYINQAGAVGLGMGGEASLVRADNSLLNVDVFPGFGGGVRVASDNFASTNSGTLDLLAGAGPGGGPAVKVINGTTGATALSFYAFSPTFSGGVFVASGDVNHDGFNDYVVSAGPGGGPHVKIFSGNPADIVSGVPQAIASFFAYGSTFGGGATVAVADINADGFADVITGAGPGGGPHVKIFSGAALANNQQVLLASFYSGDPSNTAGLFVAAGDLGGDGSIQIITGSGPGVAPMVYALTLLQQGSTNSYLVDATQTRSFQPYSPLFTGGVRVGAINYQQSAGGSIDLLTAPGMGGGPNIKVFDPAGNFAVIDSFFFPDDPHYTGGLYLG